MELGPAIWNRFPIPDDLVNFILEQSDRAYSRIVS
jgi:hypothetical protein